MPRGGKRAGAGRPKGPSKVAIDKALYREVLRQLVVAELHPMTQAQIAAAKGLRYLVTRDKKTGKFIRVTEAMARAKQGTRDADEETIEVWEKDPSIQAYADLLNRALDKPTEQVAVTGPEGGPLEIIVKKPW